MQELFSDRIADVPRSFIREILKVAADPQVISFAGGLPNPELFPVAQIHDASAKVLATAGREVLQYSNSEGYRPLRHWIAERYRERQGQVVSVDDILITTGSQQGLDLLGKTLLNPGDGVVIEEPGYLGAIQAFALYGPVWSPVPVSEVGMDVDRLRHVLATSRPKLIYTVPNFQNPSGITYTEENRGAVAELVAGTNALLIQDDPYGDLRFSGSANRSFRHYLPDQTILLGSFSKTIAPGLRIGWIVAPRALMEKLIIAKQASDLHTNYLSQRIIHQYLMDNDLDEHIAAIVSVYGRQRDAMLASISAHFPTGVTCTRPAGGMFLWATLPDALSSMALFDSAIATKVAFVPGAPFYVVPHDANTLRLNFSCVDESKIETGIRRLGEAMRETTIIGEPHR